MSMPRAPLAALLCLALAAPSPAAVRAFAPAVASRLPAGFAPAAARLLPARGLTLSAPGLGATPGLSVSPSLAAAPVPAPAAPLSAAAAPAPVAAAPLASALAAAPLAAAGPGAPSALAAAAPAAADFERALAAVREAPSAAPDAGRASWEQAWDGAGLKPASRDLEAPAAPASSPARLARGVRSAAVAGAAALPLPALGASAGAAGALGAALPFAQAGGLLLGAYAATRALRWAIGKLAGRYGWSRNTLTLARFLASAALWGGAAGYGLVLVGLADDALLTTFGGSGAALALAVKDVAGNLVHGVHFLLTRPFTVGSRVEIDDVAGTVHELTLRYIIVRTELQPAYVYYTYSELMGKSVTLRGSYEEQRASRLKLRRPALPRGLLQALKDAASRELWRPALLSALGIAALSVLPLARAWFTQKGFLSLFESLLPWANFVLILFLARSLAGTAHGALSRLARRYGWSAPSATLLKLAASALIWGLGASFALNAVGVSWASLLTTVSISTVILGIAVNDYVSAMFQALLILLLRPFEVGDRIVVGKHEGEVLDIDFQHVVLKKDDASFILLPYASVKGFRSPREHGAKAKNQ